MTNHFSFVDERTSELIRKKKKNEAHTHTHTHWKNCKMKRTNGAHIGVNQERTNDQGLTKVKQGVLTLPPTLYFSQSNINKILNNKRITSAFSTWCWLDLAFTESIRNATHNPLLNQFKDKEPSWKTLVQAINIWRATSLVIIPFLHTRTKLYMDIDLKCEFFVFSFFGVVAE